MSEQTMQTDASTVKSTAKDEDSTARKFRKLFAITDELQKKVEGLKTENGELKKRLDQLEKIAADQADVLAKLGINPFSIPPSKNIFP